MPNSEEYDDYKEELRGRLGGVARKKKSPQWRRPVRVSQWHTPMVRVYESTTYHGRNLGDLKGTPLVDFQRRAGPTEITPVNLVATLFRLRSELEAELRKALAHPQDRVEWVYLYWKGDDIDTVGEAREQWDEGNYRTSHSAFPRFAGELGRIFEDLMEDFQDRAEFGSPPGERMWLYEATFRLIKDVSSEAGLEHVKV